jgi:hypothetical protein
MQHILPDIILEDQSTFLPLRYILDNVLVIHETIQWARETDQGINLIEIRLYKKLMIWLAFLFFFE